MSKQVAFKSKSGKEEHAELAEPAGNGKAGGVVLIQEYWGINENLRAWTDRIASDGFVTLTPDLYHGKSTKDAAEAGKLMQALDWPAAMQDIAGAVSFLKEHPRCNGKVAVVGFCMGGALTFVAATAVPGLAAVVPFYGIPEKFDASKVTAPIQAHFAKKDEWATPAAAEAIKQELAKTGKSMELHVYDSGHAFMNQHRPEAHDPASAKVAWERALAFLKKHLG
jgi:carboxymethylenebutenolidase